MGSSGSPSQRFAQSCYFESVTCRLSATALVEIDVFWIVGEVAARCNKKAPAAKYPAVMRAAFGSFSNATENSMADRTIKPNPKNLRANVLSLNALGENVANRLLDQGINSMVDATTICAINTIRTTVVAYCATLAPAQVAARESTISAVTANTGPLRGKVIARTEGSRRTRANATTSREYPKRRALISTGCGCCRSPSDAIALSERGNERAAASLTGAAMEAKFPAKE